MKWFGWFLRMLICAAANAVGGLLSMLVYATAGERLVIMRGMVCVEYRRHSLLDTFVTKLTPRGWTFGAITLGPHFAVFGPDCITPEQVAHESGHGEQMEADSLLAVILAVAGWYLHAPPWFWCALVVLPWTSYFTGGFVAVLRGEPFYRGNVSEEGARGIACMFSRGEAK